jgi:hypothetical protein
MSKFYILLLTLSFLVICSCSSKPGLADFDRKNLNQYYKIDLNYTKAAFNERAKINSVDKAMESLPLLLLSTTSNEFRFGKESGVAFRAKNRSDLQNFSTDFFEFKIENDSIIYIRDENYLDEDTKDESYLNLTENNDFVKSAVLLEYDTNYEYFIFRVTRGNYKGLEFKAVVQN